MHGGLNVSTSTTSKAFLQPASPDPNQTGQRQPAPSGFSTAAVINRTHRVVRERAQTLHDRRRRLRALWIPLAVCAAFILMSSHAIWSLLVQYELSPTGIPDASEQMLVLLLWFLPATAAVLAAVWFRRTRSRTQSESAQ